jgi:hypothetical protein
VWKEWRYQSGWLSLWAGIHLHSANTLKIGSINPPLLIDPWVANPDKIKGKIHGEKGAVQGFNDIMGVI